MKLKDLENKMNHVEPSLKAQAPVVVPSAPTTADAPETVAPIAPIDGVEIGASHEHYAAEGLAGLNKYLGKMILPKYKDKYFAWVNGETARQRFRGWKPIKIDFDRHTALECGTEEAERTTENILCWKPMERWEAEQAEERKRRAQLGANVEDEDSVAQAEAFNAASPRRKDIFATPLREQDVPQD